MAKVSNPLIGVFLDLDSFGEFADDLTPSQRRIVSKIDSQVGKLRMFMDRLKEPVSPEFFQIHCTSFSKHEDACEELVTSLVEENIPRKLIQFLMSCLSESLSHVSTALSQVTRPSNDSGLAPTSSSTLVYENETQLALVQMQYHAQVIAQVPTFSGNILEFDRFITLFNKSVHDLKYLPSEQKWEALRSKLSGPPLALVTGCSGSQSDYEQAYTALKREYTSPFRKSMALLAQRDCFPRVSDSLSSLEEFYYKTSSWVSAVTNLQTNDLSSFLLFESIFNRLPKQLKDSFCSSSLDGETIPSIQQLLSFLSSKVEAIRNVPNQLLPRSSSSPTAPVRRNRSPIQYSTQRQFHIPSGKYSSLSVTQSKEELMPGHVQPSLNFDQTDYSSVKPFRVGRPARSIGCFFCHKDHFLYRCPDWLNLEPKVRSFLVDQYQLCSRCLSNRHISIDCQSTRTCIHCGEDHHSTLHPLEEVGKKPEVRNDRFARKDLNATPSRSRLRSPSPSCGASNTMGSHLQPNDDCEKSVSDVSLRDHKAATSCEQEEYDAEFPPLSQQSIELKKRSDSKSCLGLDNISSGCNIRVLLDSGSEASLITSTAAKKCNLQMSSFSGRVSGIGGSMSTPILGMTTAFLQLLDGRVLPITFRVMEQVTSNLPSRNLPHDRWPHLNQFDLADPNYFKSAPVDAILGSEIFAQVISSRTVFPIRGSPMLLDTLLGWVTIGAFSHGASRSVHFEPSIEDNRPRTRYLHRYSVNPPSSVPTQLLTDTEIEQEISSAPTQSFLEHDFLKANINKEIRPLQPQKTEITYVCPDRKSQVHAHSDPSENLIVFNRELLWDKYFGPSQLSEDPSPSYRKSSSFEVDPTRILLDSACDQIPATLTSNLRENSGSLENLLNRLFEIESVQECVPLTPDELKAEELFQENYYRLPSGRFCVPLLLQRPASELGDSRRVAVRRLFQLENRFRKNQLLREQYKDFMAEYESLGHMKPVLPPSPGSKVYYMPHHAVFKRDCPASKIRVVFNGSQRSTTGVTLNDLLFVGPKLQTDIAEVVTRFREHRFVFTADIRQMFRNIEIRPQERDLLRVVWRPSPDHPIQDYHMTTVTYGTASAPFLANRVLKTIAEINKEQFPLASDVLLNRTYVDDCHGGGATVESALLVRSQLIDSLLSAKFELRKWASNHPDVLKELPENYLLPSCQSVEFRTEEEKSLKVLGLSWNPWSDSFHYTTSPIPDIQTKRELASQIGRIFDPLGWLMPLAVKARVIQRTVCLAGYDWDDTLPAEIQEQWAHLASDFASVQNLTIPRHMLISLQNDHLVGFADASEQAYAAVLYLVSYSSSPPTVRLILSRARMAPIKVESLPRLELLAAELLGKVFAKMRPLFPQIPFNRQFACSDSTIALSWITAEPAPVWKVFVGNRVAKTLTNVARECWYHVRSTENPADLASRGALPSQLALDKLWWSGPTWLSLKPESWPLVKIRPNLEDQSVADERRNKSPTPCIAAVHADFDQFELRFSSYPILRRTTAWVLRFVHNSLHSENRRSGSLTAGELQQAELHLVRRAQQLHLQALICDVTLSKPKNRLTKVLGLFLDPAGIIRVGGRLSNSNLSFQTMHPVLIPQESHLTRLIILSAHEHLLHVGPRSTLAWLRQRFWIINGRNTVQRLLASCTKCYSIKPTPFQPQLGQLPLGRTQSVFPFQETGIDYAGPFDVNITGHRGSRAFKIFISVFVCFATKAIHLEPVMDLSTDGFLQALERFVGRRGVPAVIWTDNGRNFLGAANLLRPVRRAFDNDAHRSTVVDRTSERGIEWKFIPPRAPHFGGLWEAAVKSTKRLLRVTLRGHTPSYQTFSTLIVRVEAILNSRPLSADLSSPNELRVITPGHFLAQRPLTALPEPPPHTRHSFLSSWRFVQQSTKTFWKRWQREYLLEQQQRTKWNSETKPARVGQVVLIQEDDAPPLHWPLGVITKLIPGNDKINRVAIVRTSSGIKTRPLVRLCPLPDPPPGYPLAEEDVQPSAELH